MKMPQNFSAEKYIGIHLHWDQTSNKYVNQLVKTRESDGARGEMAREHSPKGPKKETACLMPAKGKRRKTQPADTTGNPDLHQSPHLTSKNILY